MSNLHAPGLPPTTWVPVTALKPGEHIRYNTQIWTVHEVLPVAVIGGDGVIATADTAPQPVRTVLHYSNPASMAELVLT